MPRLIPSNRYFKLLPDGGRRSTLRLYSRVIMIFSLFTLLPK
uniref:Uncharacterized protein n=1 Tax=Siphoviridae sp. ctPAi1 TaxID=2826320 RepID=A0A8S5M821_9CAUD|nr:MAG TPA: hypothetical protein [Siphoviridae sp. ctPAi1]